MNRGHLCERIREDAYECPQVAHYFLMLPEDDDGWFTQACQDHAVHLSRTFPGRIILVNV